MAIKTVNIADGGGGSGSKNVNKKPQPLTEAQRKRYQEKTDRILKERDNYEAYYGKTSSTTQLLQEQEEKQRRIREYKNLIDDVTETSSDIVRYCEELKEIELSINANFRGNQAKELMRLVTQAYSQCETVIGSLNTIGSKAASQIRANGEGSYTYNDVKLQTENGNNRNASGTFSCNTNELSEILEKLKKINNNLGKSASDTNKLSSLEGCEDVKRIPNQIDLAQDQVTKTYNRLDKLIKEAEEAEAENMNIIDKGLNLLDRVWESLKSLFGKKKETTYLLEGATTAVTASPSKSKNEIDINVNKKGLEIIAKKYGLDPKSKTLVYDIAKVQGIETKKTTKEKIIKTETVPRTFDELPQYVKESNGKDAALQNKEALKESDYSFEGKYYWGEAFKSVDDYENGRLVKDLKNGNQIVWNSGKNTYIITGISENNIVTIENPNGNGSQTITLEKMASMGGAFYSYELKPEEKITTVIEAKTTKQLKNENDLTKEVLEYEGLPYINKDANLPGLKKFNPLDVFKDATGSHDKYPWLKEEPKEKDKTEVPQTNKKDENVNKWYDPESLPEDTLYDHSGYLYYEQNGLLVKETFCQDSLQYSYDLKLYILEKGYDAGYWIREDGVQMMGDRVMYATNIEHMDGKNPSNSTYKRGDAWNGTSGPGEIVGLCEASEWCAQGTHEKLFTNPKDGRVADVMFDTYTAWQTPGKHMNRYYNKDEANATRNVMSNPPADTDDRYYQTNEGWKKFFRANPQYLPEGESIEETDWEEYFKQKDPERNS